MGAQRGKWLYLGLSGPKCDSEGTFAPCNPTLLIASTPWNSPNGRLGPRTGPRRGWMGSVGPMQAQRGYVGGCTGRSRARVGEVEWELRSLVASSREGDNSIEPELNHVPSTTPGPLT